MKSRENVWGTTLLLLLIYIALLPTTKLLDLPLLGSKFQLTEFVFIPLLISFFWQKRNLSFSVMDAGVAILAACFGVVYLLSPSIIGGLELSGLFYLALLYLIVSVLTRNLVASFPFWQRAFELLAFFLIISVALSLVLYYFSGNELFEVIDVKQMPGGKTIGRVEAFTMSPNMLFYLLFWCFLTLWYLTHVNRRVLILVGLVIGMVLTFSKSIVWAAGICLWIWFNESKRMSKLIFYLGWIGILLGAILISHFVATPEGSWENANAEGAKLYIGEKSIAEFDGWEIRPSSYVYLKKAAWKIFLENPILGKGLGSFGVELKKKQEEGVYPEQFPVYDPHSTYLGLMAETGIIGASGLILFIILSFKQQLTQKKLNAQAAEQSMHYLEGLYKANIIFLLFLLLEAISTDVLHFRQLWISLGIINGLTWKPELRPY